MALSTIGIVLAQSHSDVAPETISDFGNVLTPETRTKIAAILHDSNTLTRDQSFVFAVAVDRVPGSMATPERVHAYADAQMGGLGSASILNHILFVMWVSPVKSVFWISYDREIAGRSSLFLYQRRLQRIINEVHSKLDDHDTDGAVLAGTELLATELTGVSFGQAQPLPHGSHFWQWLFLGSGSLIALLALVSYRHRRANKAGRKTISAGTIIQPLYFLSCIGFWAFAFIAHSVYGRDFKDLITNWFVALPPPTGDPVLNFIIYAIFVVAGICLIWGIIVVGLYLAGIALALAFFLALFVEPLIALSKVSLTGAILAGIIGSLPVVWLVRKYRVQITSVFWRVAEPVYGIFFDWWLTPILMRGKEKKIMDDVLEKRERYEAIVSKIQSECPGEVGDISISLGYKVWISSALERFIARQKGKNFAEQIRLLTLAKQYYSEYAAALEAKDTFTRVQRGDTSKERDEEAELRGLGRQKQKLTLQREIADLQEQKPPRPAPSTGSPQERIVAALRHLKEEKQRKRGDCNGDPECEAEVERVYEDARMRIMEGR